MLQVCEYLSKFSNSLEALESLKSDFGIKYNIWEECLVVLNYCQIDSPKYDTITLECRSLVLELDTWEVVSRSFDRFFNLGEYEETTEDWVRRPSESPARFRTMSFFEKMDGSLLGVFKYKGQVLYRTRSVIMPDSSINGFSTSWKDRIEQCIDFSVVNEILDLYKGYTLICELICPENRVVVDYQGETKITLLACRGKNDYCSWQDLELFASALNFSLPEKFSFSSTEECQNTVHSLKDLKEGIVAYDTSGKPCVKIKNPAYVAAHHLRGEGLNEKRILDLLLMEEHEEYLSVFPCDGELFSKYTMAYEILKLKLYILQEFIKLKEVQSLPQKEFALIFKDFEESAIAFQVRKGVEWEVAFKSLTEVKRRNLILNCLEEGL